MIHITLQKQTMAQKINFMYKHEFGGLLLFFYLLNYLFKSSNINL
jgi:hypothetical protein